jgi:hypothetical protein
MKRLWFVMAGLIAGAALIATDANAGKKDDTLIWATDRDNPIADPFYINTRELVVIGHHVWDTLVFIDPRAARSSRCSPPSGRGPIRRRSNSSSEWRQVPLRQGDGCRRRGLHAEPRGKQRERDCQICLAGLDQERREDR